MSSNAPYTHRRKWRFGCQTKKRSGAPSALKRSLTGGFFLACRIDRLIPLAALCLITCIATILNPDNGPLFMVAGDPNAAVGTTIGFVGDVIIPGHVAESALRASLVYTIAWIPAAAIMGVTAVGVGTAETTAQLSQAKSVPGGAAALARVIPQTIALSLAYFLSCAVAFTLKTLTFGPPLTEAAWGTALAITLTNCLLLCAIHLASALIAAVCRLPLLALFLSLLISIGPLLAYPKGVHRGKHADGRLDEPHCPAHAHVLAQHIRGFACGGRGCRRRHLCRRLDTYVCDLQLSGGMSMNHEKQCPSARNHAPLNRGVSPDRNALAKAAGARGSSAPKPTGPRRVPAQRFRVAAASLLVGVRAHLGLLALAGTAIACLVFLFAGSGSWMFALTEDSGIGFAPDPAYWTTNAEATAVEALTCSALAGTVFLPFTTLAVCGRLCGALYATDARAVSRARGTSPWRLAVGDLLAASLPVQALYAATVVATAIALSPQAGQSNLLGAVLASLAPRLALVLTVNESFVACALALYRLIPNRAAALGIMAVGFIAACVAQLSFPTMILPIHAGLWMHISSATALHTLVLPALVFSGITGVIALALYAHMQR